LKNVFKWLEEDSELFYKSRKKKNRNNNIRFKIVKGDNDWKFEFVVLKNEYRIFRMKVYDKTIEI
jgi:hypothetical protein